MPLLEAAAREVEAHRMGSPADSELLIERFKTLAREATNAAKERPSSSKLALALAERNAETAAALSGTDFPSTTSVAGLLFVGNTYQALAAHAALAGDDQSALDLGIAALDAMRSFRALSRIRSIDGTVYAIAARAGTSAGRLAAANNLNVRELLRAFDSNVTEPFAKLMQSGELSAPRAFAVVALLRAALARPETDQSTEYLGELRDEIRRQRRALTPKRGVAAQRFNADLDAALDEAEFREQDQRPTGFKWGAD